MQSELFGRLLKAGINSIANCEGKTAPIVEDDLGQQIGLTGYTIQRYKAGHIPPDQRTINILATAIVKRGFLNSEWAERFLHSAQYPTPDHLLSQLFPSVSEQPREERIFQNLPAATYSTFIMRQQSYRDIAEGLRQRSAIVLLVSMGGMGKTSLAREIAQRSLEGDDNIPVYDAVVWVSDKGHEGMTSLDDVLNAIALTMDYAGYLRFSFEEKKYEIDQLLRKWKILLVVDNFETISDKDLLKWLLRLPEPSKAIVTSREYLRAFRNNTYVVELRGMTEDEAKELIQARLRILGIGNRLGDWSQLEPLIVATGGNPKAIEIALGYIKYENKPLPTVLDDIYSARAGLFDDLFARCWTMINSEAQQILLTMYLFPFGTTIAALSSVSSVKGYSFDTALERLTDLALIDVYQQDFYSELIYSLHPLVRAFAGAKLASATDFDMEARNRWLKWYSDYAAQIGFCWDDIDRLKLLDAEGQRETIEVLLDWALKNRRFDEAIQISRDIRYYYYVRGFWSTSNNLIRAEAARRLSDSNSEFEALTYHINIASKQGNLTEVQKYLPRLRELQEQEQIDRAHIADFRHATALYYLACREFDEAIKLWQENVTEPGLSPHALNANKRWMAICLYRKGERQLARTLFEKLLEDSKAQHFTRGIVSASTHLISIDIDEGLLDSAEQRLLDSLQLAEAIEDRRAILELELLKARIYLHHSEGYLAKRALDIAIDGFGRLGMYNELTYARNLLAEIDK